jgi:hypothetical protein
VNGREDVVKNKPGVKGGEAMASGVDDDTVETDRFWQRASSRRIKACHLKEKDKCLVWLCTSYLMCPSAECLLAVGAFLLITWETTPLASVIETLI